MRSEIQEKTSQIVKEEPFSTPPFCIASSLMVCLLSILLLQTIFRWNILKIVCKGDVLRPEAHHSSAVCQSF